MTKFLGVTIPEELYNKIESDRKDFPRSYYCRKLLEYAYQSGFLLHKMEPLRNDWTNHPNTYLCRGNSEEIYGVKETWMKH